MTDEKKKMINNVPAEAFLVRDKSLTDIDAPFYKGCEKKVSHTHGIKGTMITVIGCL